MVGWAPESGDGLARRAARGAGQGLTSAAIRTLDLVLAAVFGVLGLPVLAVFALRIRVGSRGPMLHRQVRIGRDGVPFVMVKLRTMVPDAEDGTGPVLSSWRDRRLVKGGAVARLLHVDEIPQFWNVLRGEMSMVGPRPERPEFVARLVEELPGFGGRHTVRPGLTGLAQLRGGYHCDPAAKLAYDLRYVEHRTIGRYVWLLAATPVGVVREAWQVLRRGGEAGPAPVVWAWPAASFDVDREERVDGSPVEELAARTAS